MNRDLPTPQTPLNCECKHSLYPYNLGPSTGTWQGKQIPRWIELENGGLYVPVGIGRKPDAEAGEIEFERCPGVVYRLADDEERQAVSADCLDSGQDADLHRAMTRDLDI